MNYADVIGPIVSGCAQFFGTPIQRIRNLLCGTDADSEARARLQGRLIGAIRRLDAEKAFRKAYAEAESWNWALPRPKSAGRAGGNSECESRLAAIRALEIVAGEADANIHPVMAALCAFVRDNAPHLGGVGICRPREDIQAAVAVIGRLDRRRPAVEGGRQELCRANLMLTMLTRIALPQARLAGADLTGARLDEADLAGTDLTGASLIGARLKAADLSAARLGGAEMRGAWLETANLEGACLEGADLRHARFHEARLAEARLAYADCGNWSCHRSSLRGGDLGLARNLDPASLETCFGVKSGPGRTRLPEGVAAPAHWFAAAETDDDAEAAAQAYEAAYRAWLARAPGRG